MSIFHKAISSWLGIGLIGKGGGTIAALCCCVAWYFAFRQSFTNAWVPAVITGIIIIVGVWSAGQVEPAWGKDSSKVVIDEVAGMCISLLFLPVQVKYLAAALVLFRFFDIAKPLFIRRLEQWPRGWGVMADDVLAGLYSNILMQVIVLNHVF